MPTLASEISHGLTDLALGGDTINTQSSDASARVARIIDAKLDPMEHHRQAIATYLDQSNTRSSNRQWLARGQFPLLLKKYFKRHHRHTPSIHLPTFSIVECPTSLMFALALIAASYVPTLGLRAKDIVTPSGYAYHPAVMADELDDSFV